MLSAPTLISTEVSAAKKFTVKVNLLGVAHGINDEYIVTVDTYYKGYPDLQQRKFIETNYQVCPGDWSAECYTPAGTFSFSAKKVSQNTYIKVCAADPLDGTYSCNQFQKKKGKSLPTLAVEVPQGMCV
jgi:hypothetical protein